LTLTVHAGTAAGQLEAAWHMLGSEHLSQFFYEEGPGGSRIGAEFQEALRLARSELGAMYIRAHAILRDEQGVPRRSISGCTTVPPGPSSRLTSDY
jgi:hypothetical protein